VLVYDLRSIVQDSWSKVVLGAVRRGLERLRLPARAELRVVAERIEQLERRLARMQSGQENRAG
jgi:hypothetical protein